MIGIFPNQASLIRIVGTLLQAQDDEWQVAERRYFSAESMRKIDAELEGGEVSEELPVATAQLARMAGANVNHLTRHGRS